MQNLFDSYKKTKSLHHAYFLVGDSELIFKSLVDFLEKNVGVVTSGNPDFWVGRFGNMAIDDARFITESSQRKSFSRNLATEPLSRKFFVIISDFITTEAQNSLLKVFEEPTEGTHFYIISPQDNLLPTLRSRMHVVKCESVKVESVKVSENFFEVNMKERLDKVKQIVEGISDEKLTKQEAINFVNHIESNLYHAGVVSHKRELELCQKAREHLLSRGATIKMILENLVINI